MNIKVLFKFLAVGLLIISQSCYKKECSCAFFDSISVKLVNSQGQSLFAGSGAIYMADSVRIFNMQNNSILYNGEVKHDAADSSTLILSFYSPGKNYIYFNSQSPKDSIELIKTNREVTGVRFNNVTILPINGKFIFVK